LPTSSTLDLTPNELLTSTRAVRRHLDLTRPVAPEIVEECISIAQQAPTASNLQDWHFLVVRDAGKREELGKLYRKAAEIYFSLPSVIGKVGSDAPKREATQARVRQSALYLAEHIHQVPIHVIPCIQGRTEDSPPFAQAAKWGSILPAAWSFMLAARARGLGTCFTTFHLFYEERAARILGIPFRDIMQVALIPVAYTKRVSLKPAPREPLSSMIHWDNW